MRPGRVLYSHSAMTEMFARSLLIEKIERRSGHVLVCEERKGRCGKKEKRFEGRKKYT